MQIAMIFFQNYEKIVDDEPLVLKIRETSAFASPRSSLTEGSNIKRR
jgi:hypothetical protein